MSVKYSQNQCNHSECTPRSVLAQAPVAQIPEPIAAQTVVQASKSRRATSDEPVVHEPEVVQASEPVVQEPEIIREQPASDPMIASEEFRALRCEFAKRTKKVHRIEWLGCAIISRPDASVAFLRALVPTCLRMDISSVRFGKIVTGALDWAQSDRDQIPMFDKIKHDFFVVILEYERYRTFMLIGTSQITTDRIKNRSLIIFNGKHDDWIANGRYVTELALDQAMPGQLSPKMTLAECQTFLDELMENFYGTQLTRCTLAFILFAERVLQSQHFGMLHALATSPLAGLVGLVGTLNAIPVWQTPYKQRAATDSLAQE